MCHSNYSINHRHPGGASILDKSAELHATLDFQAVEHSLHALNILATLLVAQIEDPGFQIALTSFVNLIILAREFQNGPSNVADRVNMSLTSLAVHQLQQLCPILPMGLCIQPANRCHRPSHSRPRRIGRGRPSLALGCR